jgi:hypothetical protein
MFCEIAWAAIRPETNATGGAGAVQIVVAYAGADVERSPAFTTQQAAVAWATATRSGMVVCGGLPESEMGMLTGLTAANSGPCSSRHADQRPGARDAGAAAARHGGPRRAQPRR